MAVQAKIVGITKNLLFAIIRIRMINGLLRGALEPFSSILPEKTVNRIPVVGKVRLQLSDSMTVVLVSDGNDSLASRLYWSGLVAFEPETIDLFLHLLEYSSVVFDVGAYTGIFALISAISGVDKSVHAFEPVPRIFEYLLKNVEANDLSNVIPVCSAVTDYDGEAQLYIPRATTLPFSASTLRGFRDAQYTLTVPALKLDSYVAANHIARVDLMKIDTEGTEPKVLEGAKQILERDRPVIICEVLKGVTESQLHSIFDNAGYRFFLVTSEGLIRKERIVGDPSYTNRNYLFIPEGKMSEILRGINVI